MFYYAGICYVVFLYFSNSHALEVVPVGPHSEYHFLGQDDDGTYRPVDVKVVKFPQDKVVEVNAPRNIFEKLPFKPTKVNVDSWNETDSSISVTWTQHKLRNLRYFVLKFIQECEEAGPFTEINYVLVNATYFIQKHGLIHHTKFNYRFVSVNEHTVRVSVRIWSLYKLEIHNDGRLHFIPDGRTLSSSATVTKERIQQQQLAEACLCNSSVIARIVKTDGDSPDILGQVIVSGVDVFIPTNIKLIVNDSKVVKTAFHKTSITLKFAEPGTYYILVTRECPVGLKTECGRTDVQDVISDKVTVKPKTLVGLPDLSVSHGTSGSEAVDTNLIVGSAKDQNEISLIAVMVAVSFLLIVIAALSVGCYFNWLFPSKFSYNLAQRAENKVAIVFTKDSENHVTMVRSLASALLAERLNACLVGDESCSALVQNWIDEGEAIADKFNDIIFIVSPGMHEVCRKRDVKEIDSEKHTEIHRLPAVVLTSVKSKYHKLYKNEPRLYTVCLDKKSKESKTLNRVFCLEHRSIFKNSTTFLSFNDPTHISRNCAFHKLVQRIKVRSPCVWNFV